MADVNVATNFTLRLEDSTLSGISTKSPQDKGGLTRYGIASRWHPELVRAGFYTMNAADALVIARGVYAKEYASALMLDRVQSQAIANALLSFAILDGCAPALMAMQRTLNSNDVWRAVDGAQPLALDGSAGPKTLAQINSCPNVMCQNLLKSYVTVMRGVLTRITVADASQTKWLKGWMNRCTAVAAQV